MRTFRTLLVVVAFIPSTALFGCATLAALPLAASSALRKEHVVEVQDPHPNVTMSGSASYALTLDDSLKAPQRTTCGYWDITYARLDETLKNGFKNAVGSRAVAQTEGKTTRLRISSVAIRSQEKEIGDEIECLPVLTFTAQWVDGKGAVVRETRGELESLEYRASYEQHLDALTERMFERVFLELPYDLT